MQCDVSAFCAKHELYVNDNAEVRVLTVGSKGLAG